MRYRSGFDNSRPLQLDVLRGGVLEQTDPVSEQDRYEVDLDLIKLVRVDMADRRTRPRATPAGAQMDH